MHDFEFLGSPMPVLRLRWSSGCAFAAAVIALAGFNAPQPAEARHQSSYQSYYGFFSPPPRQQYRHRRPEREPQQKAARETEVKKPLGPMFAVVSLADQRVSFYDANGLWEQSVISTGVAGHPTPTGIFSILEKDRYHHSNIYSGAPMPYMQRLAWTGVAMHEGVVTGHPASHGCIRLPGAFARKLFGVTSVGQRVVVSPQDVTPAAIVNAHLPTPRLLAPPKGFEEKAVANQGRKIVETVALDNPDASAKAAAEPKLLNPGEFIQALKTAAAAKAAGAAKAKKAALAIIASKGEEARQAARELGVAEEALRRARLDVDDANRALLQAQGDEAIQGAAELKTAAKAKLAAAENRARDASEAKAAIDQDVASAQSAIRDADAQSSAAGAEAKDAVLRAEPISIFISRKTRHLYVRQATQHLFDIPITIRDPDRPIGSHLFVATRSGDDGASLRWMALTPPAAVEVKFRRHSSRKGRPVSPEEEAPPVATFPETASAALDRIEIPPEAAERLGERLWVGATLIVSDVGMSGEGRYPMDFMILGHTVVRDE